MKLAKIFATGVLTLVTSAASAGLVQPAPVDVDLVNNNAQGDMRTARGAKDDVTFIGCGIRKFDDGAGNTFTFGFCQATDADEESIICQTFSDDLMDGIDAIADSSFITFSWTDVVDESGEIVSQDCRRIGVSTQSFYLPKK